MFGIVFSLLVLFLFHEWYWKRRNLPPGPLPMPLLGNLIQVLRNPPGYDAFLQWRKEYGSVYTYWIGVYPVVVLADYPTIRDTIIRDGEKYTGRLISPFALNYRGGAYGIIENVGDDWREQRRLAIHSLKDFGMGRNLMEERVMSEVHYLLERLEKKRTASPQEEFDIGVGSVINNIIFGYRFDESRVGEFQELKALLGEYMNAMTKPSVGCIFSCFSLSRWPYFKDVWGKIVYIRDRIFGFFRRQIEEKRKSIDFESMESTDLIECYLKEQHKRRDQPDFGGYSDHQLLNNVYDLWIAGMETTSNTLTLGLVYILNAPEVQKKIHEELDREISGNRLVTGADKNRLHYINATICEIQRLANLLPVNLPRTCSEDVTVKGYTLKAGTVILPQISSVLYDDEIFPDPYKFDPTRFLNTDGTLKRVDELIPFSVGKRACLGEGVARLELFLFVANVFQKFEIRCHEIPSVTKRPGVTVQALPYKCEFIDRWN